MCSRRQSECGRKSLKPQSNIKHAPRLPLRDYLLVADRLRAAVARDDDPAFRLAAARLAEPLAAALRVAALFVATPAVTRRRLAEFVSPISILQS